MIPLFEINPEVLKGFFYAVANALDFSSKLT